VGRDVLRVVWKERCEVAAHADKFHPGAAAAVRDAKGLVQVQMQDVPAEPALGTDLGTKRGAAAEMTWNVT
jgi:hypothetical protein